MKIPRDLSGSRLAKLLGSYGYVIVRQTGSHIRLSSRHQGFEHNITIPNHSPIKIGTLANVLSEVADYLQVDRQSILKGFFD